jgi:SAM-dependent methyltransferase
MTDSNLDAQIAAAEAYETFFVPALFAEWAPRVVDAAGVAPGHRVLDVACGTGVLAREVHSRVTASGTGAVVGLDPAPGMLEVARRREPAIEWHAGVAEDLPFPDGSFDVVVSQFGLMFFPDRAGALREMRRVLKPGGAIAVAVWDSLDNTPAYAAEVALLERLAGNEAADALRAPFVLGDTEELGTLFESAGLAQPEILSHAGAGRFPSIRAMVEGDLRGWLPVMGVHLPEEIIQQILEAAETELQPFLAENGTVLFDSPAHIVVV